MKKKDLLVKNIQKLKTLDKKSGTTSDLGKKKKEPSAAPSKKPATKPVKPALKKVKTPPAKQAEEKKKTKAPIAPPKKKPAQKTPVKDIKKPGPSKKEEKKIEPKKTVIKKTAPQKKAVSTPAKTKQTARTLKKRPLPIQNTQHELKSFEASITKNRVMSMTVSPGKLYAYWEITKDKLEGYKGSLNIKITNLKTGEFFYLPISERIDEHFIHVSPNGRYAVQLGVIDHKGTFIIIEKAPDVSTPPSQPENTPAGKIRRKIARMTKTGKLVIFETDEIGLPEEFFRTTAPSSSY